MLLWNTDLTQQAIAERLKVNQSSVSRVKKKIKKGHSLDGKRVGKRESERKTTARLDRNIVLKSLENRRASCRKLSSDLGKKGLKISRKFTAKSEQNMANLDSRSDEKLSKDGFHRTHYDAMLFVTSWMICSAISACFTRLQGL